MKSFFKGFGYAFWGIVNCFRTQRNFRFHTVFALFVLRFAVFFSLSRTEYALLFLTMGVVLAAEFFNTSVESAVDLVTLEKHPLAKTAKDCAAGGVLITAISSVAVGIALFAKAEGFKRMFAYYIGSPIRIFILVLFIALGFFVVFGSFKGKTHIK